MKQGYRIVFNHIPKVRQSVRREIGRAVDTTIHAIQAKAQAAIQNPPKTGRVYEKYRPRRRHQASAPGEAPATDLGTLANSISAEMTGEMSGTVTVHAEYGPHLEYGTVKMAARPFLGPAVDDERESFKREVEEALRRGSKV